MSASRALSAGPRQLAPQFDANPVQKLDLPPVASFPAELIRLAKLSIRDPSWGGAPMAHDEWTKTLPDGKIGKYIYDEIAEVCSASVAIGEYSKSRSNLAGPLTREQVEELFVHEVQRLTARRSAGHS